MEYIKNKKGIYVMDIVKGNKYLSDLKDENNNKIFFELPNGILDKQLTGCGGTTLALNDVHPYIICSPRIKLIENKYQQTPNTFLFTGDTLESQLKEYIKNNSLPKILTTYDSLGKVLRNIKDVSKYRILVDEFQCILSDSSFKYITELKFLSLLKMCPYKTFLSATPVMDEFINGINFFKDMPYYKLNWLDAEKVTIKRIKSNSPIMLAKRIIELYKKYNGWKVSDNDIISKECVIYLNSVSNIVNLVKNCNLSSNEVNIIVANNVDNDKLIKSLGKDFCNGTFPLKGEKNKMFTLCTSTAYFGVDMYSDNALSFVISDCSTINTSVDIATELQQIAGRQRLETNPFRNLIYFIYNTNRSAISETEFNNFINEKKNKSLTIINYYNNCTDKLIRDNKIEDINKLTHINQNNSYIYIEDNIFKFNDLSFMCDKRTFKVQKSNYLNGISVKKAISDNKSLLIKNDELWKKIDITFKCNVIERDSFEKKMKTYCDLRMKYDELDINIPTELRYDKEITTYYNLLGANKIKALNYKRSKLKNEVETNINNKNIILNQIVNVFVNNERYTKEQIKNTLQNIYDNLGLSKKAKTTDLSDFGIYTKEVKITINGKRINGLELSY